MKISVLPILTAFLFLGFSSKKQNSEIALYSTDLPEFYSAAIKNDVQLRPQLPKLGKGYVGFKEAVGFKESQGDYQVINQFGYLGKYQFGKGTLEMLGIYQPQKFINSPALQEAAFYANASRNKWILRREIKKYVGKTIHGVQITESGILAAAHLAGPGGVKVYLRNGRYSSDAFGTTVKYYLNKFKGYDTSFVVPVKNAKVVI